MDSANANPLCALFIPTNHSFCLMSEIWDIFVPIRTIITIMGPLFSVNVKNIKILFLTESLMENSTPDIFNLEKNTLQTVQYLHFKTIANELNNLPLVFSFVPLIDK